MVSHGTGTRRELLGSFRVRLAAGVGGLALLTLVVVGLYGAELAMRMRREYAGQQLHDSARNIGLLLASMLEEREKEIEILSRSPTLAGNRLDSPAVSQSLDLRTQERQEYAWLGIAGRDGRVLTATGGLLHGADVESRPWFQAALKGPFTGDVHDAQLLARLLPPRPDSEPLRFVDIAAPIRAESGEVRGVLGAHLHWSWVTAVVEKTLRDGDPAALRGVRALILAKDGTALYPPDLVGRKPPTAPAGGRGVVDDSGGRLLVARVPMPPTRHSALGWRIVLQQPLDIALAPVFDLRDRLVVSGIALSFALAAAAYAMAARISRPLERILRAVRRVGEGKGSVDDFPSDCGSSEMTALSRSVRAMTETLLEREDRLERTVAERTRELSDANRELALLALQDPLTGTANRRAFDERCAFEDARSRRTGKPFGVLIVDADCFKAINDGFGHAVGDRVLQQLAAILLARSRETDLVARLGGEEFALLLPELTSADDAMRVGEQIRAAVERHDFDEIGRVTVSIGCAVADGRQTPAAVALRHADAALYLAKERGRNRCLAATAG